MKKIRKDKAASALIVKKDSVKTLRDDKQMLFSFRHLCKTQGSSFEDWAEDGHLVGLMRRLEEFSSKTISEAQGDNFVIYGNFPAKSRFQYPTYIGDDANWARIHVDGTHIIAGHVVDNIFYVVFLDSRHEFYVTGKKHT